MIENINNTNNTNNKNNTELADSFNIYNKISDFPDDIIQLITNYLSPYNKIFLNKKYYYKYNYYIDKYIIPEYSEIYIRDIIKKDYSFVFKEILNRKFNRWVLMHNYSYKFILYKDYIHFILYYSSINNSYKCNKLINLKLKKLGLKKDWL
jgi:hypothetical protein